ncbi:MAG: hypothetical protein AAF745_13245, partial [Planctomycetota bacterium]
MFHALYGPVSELVDPCHTRAQKIAWLDDRKLTAAVVCAATACAVGIDGVDGAVAKGGQLSRVDAFTDKEVPY